MLKNKPINNLVPYSIIILAAGGDDEAINAVLRHYRRYINVLSTRKVFDIYGTPRSFVDERLRCRLEIKLISAIFTFNIA